MLRMLQDPAIYFSQKKLIKDKRERTIRPVFIIKAEEDLKFSL